MKEKTSLFIVNPNAGNGKARRQLTNLKSIVKKYSFCGKLVVTKSQEQTIDLATEYANLGFDQIIAVGGDGTLNEVVNGVMKSENRKAVHIGLIPLGGGNDFASYFNFSKNIEDNIQRIKNDKTVKIDLGKIEDYYFINSLGMGFDAVVAKESESIRFANGLFRYLIAVFKVMRIYKGIDVNISIRNFETEKNLTLISIGNGNRSGGGFYLTPDANPSDGLFDILVADNLSIWQMLRLLPKAIKGKHLFNDNVALIKSDHIQVISQSPIPIYLDGEIPVLENPKDIKVKIVPKAINFIC